MKAPTGGPNEGHDPTRRMPPSRAWCAAGCAALSYLLVPIGAAAETTRFALAEGVQLRVTGSLTIEASASQLPGGSELEARLIDDGGHPLPGALLQIKPLNTTLALAARDCQSRSISLPANANGAYLVRSNDAGSLCVHFDGTPERAEFELSFTDSDGLYPATSRKVVADSRTRSVQIAFAPAPSVLALERESQTFTLATRPVPALAAGEPLESLSISLSMKRDGQAMQALGNASVEIAATRSSRFRADSWAHPGRSKSAPILPAAIRRAQPAL
ncbi:MAG: hypothetical protein WDO74_06500 [Pseudomonadota bacterium]